MHFCLLLLSVSRILKIQRTIHGQRLCSCLFEVYFSVCVSVYLIITNSCCWHPSIRLRGCLKIISCCHNGQCASYYHYFDFQNCRSPAKHEALRREAGAPGRRSSVHLGSLPVSHTEAPGPLSEMAAFLRARKYVRCVVRFSDREL